MAFWRGFRFAVLLASFLSPFFAPSSRTPELSIGWSDVVTTLVIAPVGLLFVVGIQRLNPRSASVWRYPSWDINPFTLKEPLQFFHFAGYVSLAGGLGLLAHQRAVNERIFPDDCLSAVLGLGFLAGVQLCIRIYRKKMASHS